MTPAVVRVLRALFFAYLGFTVLHIAYVVYHEPFSFDAWNVAVDTNAEPPSIGRFFAFWHHEYTTSNPRIGQPMAYWAYKLVPVAEIGTPLAFLAIVVGGFIFGTGRWPRLAEGRDLAALAIGIGCMWFIAPDLPAHLFCRAYATNYVWLAAIQLWFLVPIRLIDPSAPRDVSVPKLVAYGLLGVVAGMGNEHVGPTLIAGVIGYGVWIWRKHRVRPRLLWAGAVGLVAGYALIFFAPGQASRYEGFTERTTIMQNIMGRGIRGNAEIFGRLLEAAAPLIVLLVCVIGISFVGERSKEEELAAVRERQRRAMTMFAIAAGAVVLMTATMLASPLHGPRFFFHPMFLLLGATLGVIVAFLQQPRWYVPFVAIAVIASVAAAALTIPKYKRLARASEARLAKLAATPIGTDGTVEAWEQVSGDWWFLGDDCRDDKKRGLVANYFALAHVIHRAHDLANLLGYSDTRGTLRYEFDPPLCIDALDKLDVPKWATTDIRELHAQLKQLVADSARYGKLKWIDLMVTFVGGDPPLPRDKLFIGRWKDGVFEGYAAKLKRQGRSKQREIVLDPELKKSPWEIYQVIIGNEPKRLGMSTDGKPITYVPSRTGQYWTLACKEDYCFVVLATTHAF